MHSSGIYLILHEVLNSVRTNSECYLTEHFWKWAVVTRVRCAGNYSMFSPRWKTNQKHVTLSFYSAIHDKDS